MDPRIAKTKDKLQRALLELASEKDLDLVTVRDITERAGVNRTTFYLHYADPATLLADAVDQIVERAGAGLHDIDITASEPPAQLAEFLTHAELNREVYRRIFADPGYALVYARLRDRLQATVKVRGELANIPHPEGVPFPIIAAAVTGSILGMIGEWIAEDPHANPTEAARWIWLMVRPPSGSTP
ncbi:TetR/AcrR family transcriptional regulator [Demequina sp.]|uniref:TetR/AcrR family transcriptional regulator n=1 Tax=Demequina sp. TaxID=2050685 RepID=UPI003D0980E6